jgi:hypothetical protein
MRLVTFGRHDGSIHYALFSFFLEWFVCHSWIGVGGLRVGMARTNDAL